jgi:hypothetical protein
VTNYREEKHMKKIMMSMMVMLGLIICGLIMTGCLDSMPKVVTEKTATNVPDPETGIAAWISAVNDRNYGAVYDLMPQSKRTGISREQFIRFNKENPSPFIASGLVVNDYFILEKRVTGLNATVVAGLRTIRPPGSDGTLTNETVFFTFEATFEGNTWTVWTR